MIDRRKPAESGSGTKKSTPHGFLTALWRLARGAYAPLDRLLRRLAETIENDGIYRSIQLLGILGILGIVYGAAQFWMEKDKRAVDRQNQAWAILMSAPIPKGNGMPHIEGKPDSTGNDCPVRNWGLMNAVEQLVADSVSLESLDLPYVLLKGIEVPNAKMIKARLPCATIDNSNFSGADLYGGNLKHANIACVNLGGARLTGADLDHVTLRKSDLTGADLTGANIKDAKLKGTILKGAILDGANFARSKFLQTDLREADLSRAIDIEPAQLETSCMKKGVTELPEQWSAEQRSSFPWEKAICRENGDGSIKIDDEKECT